MRVYGEFPRILNSRRFWRQLKRLFPESIRTRIVGATPLDDPREGFARHREVLAFLHSRGLENRDWIAIDDNPLHYPQGCPVLLIDSAVGFNRDTGRQLVELARKEGATSGELEAGNG